LSAIAEEEETSLTNVVENCYSNLPPLVVVQQPSKIKKSRSSKSKTSTKDSESNGNNHHSSETKTHKTSKSRRHHKTGKYKTCPCKKKQESHISFLCLAIQMSFIFHALHNILYIHTPLIKSIVSNNSLREMAQLFSLIFSLFFTFKKEISSKKRRKKREYKVSRIEITQATVSDNIHGRMMTK